jgi:hypothetical protein
MLCALAAACLLALCVDDPIFAADTPSNSRPLRNEKDQRYWLENMVWHHRFTLPEVTAATGLPPAQVPAALERLNISAANRPKRPLDAPLFVLPYPGGRHPRIGFLEGAVRPQRETKISVFAPWDETSYVVADVPEAIWSNLGLTYLAHTHIPTIWDQQGIALPPLEWQRHHDGTLTSERTLPNGIVFGTRVTPARDAVHFEMWLVNGTSKRLTDLRVQNCVMLKGAAGFDQQTNENKVFAGPYAACRSMDGRRWVITAWDPLHRTWGNAPCPCLHSDPQFPDCEPGQTQYLRGWLSFYEGTDIHGELARIEQTGWRQRPVSRTARTSVRGTIVDADTGQPIPARVHIESGDGQWYLAECDDPTGSAVHYNKQPTSMPRSVEVHTTLSAHPFRAELPAGEYTFRVERGKEYMPERQSVTVGERPIELLFALKRWINMADRGWYSGDTHVHRGLDELPNVMLAEDLNVALPLTYWVRQAGVAPAQGDAARGDAIRGKLIEVDAQHVIYPMNTEYELFTVGGRQHTLGALFVLGHKQPLQNPAPPVGPVAVAARAQGALLDLDKHSWPWSLMLVPVMKVDLFELANNHLWQTEFGFRGWTHEMAAEWMQLEQDQEGFTERGWLDFGLKTYYALLNCGFRMRASAGTASGVHPVQLGFGRVYVHLPDGFAYDRWMAGLAAGRTFITTGPMLEVQFNGKDPGHTFQADHGDPVTIRLAGTVHSARPIERIEAVVNGEVTQSIGLTNAAASPGGYENPIDSSITLEGSSWIAVRCFQQHPRGRVRFAHTNPIHIDIPGKPLRPRRHEVQYLIDRIQAEIARNEHVLSADALGEYRDALKIYQEIATKE